MVPLLHFRPQFPERLLLNLPDAFARDTEMLTDHRPVICKAPLGPFRFESGGEAFYYLRKYRIGLRNVLIGRMGLKQ
jgi:hypothetical protein